MHQSQQLPALRVELSMTTAGHTNILMNRAFR